MELTKSRIEDKRDASGTQPGMEVSTKNVNLKHTHFLKLIHLFSDCNENLFAPFTVFN